MWVGKGKIKGLVDQMEERKIYAVILPHHHVGSGLQSF